MTITEYLDAAKRRQKLSSDTQLAARLDINQSNVSGMRTGKMWPADKTMVRIAELSGSNPQSALIDLHIWKADSEPVIAVWTQVRRSLKHTAAALPLAAMLLAGNGFAAKAATSELFNITVQSIHYAPNDGAKPGALTGSWHHLPTGLYRQPRALRLQHFFRKF